MVRSARGKFVNFRIVECFDAETNTCPIIPVCKLKGVLGEAL